VSVDCAGQGVEVLDAVVDGVAVADVVPPDADVPSVVRSFFPLNETVNYDGHKRPFFIAQVTELADGVFVGFVYNHALSDGTAFWNFINAWGKIVRARLSSPVGGPRVLSSRMPPLFERWSPASAPRCPTPAPGTGTTRQPSCSPSPTVAPISGGAKRRGGQDVATVR
jgi:hypothetical protein